MSVLAVVTKPADQSTDDVDLVSAVRAGDDRAFELLFLRYQSRITAYVRGMVRDHERAEDITQEVFMAALRRMRQTEAPIAFKPWIYEIAKNACIDAFRRSRHTNEVPLYGDDGLEPSMVARSAGPDAVVDTKFAIDNLCGAFGGLSQAHHDILVMREFEDLTYQEIGERMGMSRAGVESTLFRARRRLSEEYEELVSGERCVRVRGIVDAPPGRAIGVRDQRRMARHVAHCQPCRRYARLAGVDLDGVRSGARPARIAAFLPLPTFLRRRFDLDDAGQLLGQHAAPGMHWSTKVVTVLDPAAVAGWPRAIATAATVAVAGLGAGAAVSDHDALKGFASKGSTSAVHAAREHGGVQRSERRPDRPGGLAPAAFPTGDASDRDHPPADVPAPDAPAGRADEGPASPSHASQPSQPARPETAAPAAPAARDATPVGDAARVVGDALPDASTAELPVADPSGKPRRRHPVARLLQGAGAALGADADASDASPLRDVVSSVGDSIAQGTGHAADAGAPTTDAGSAAPATDGPIATAVGDVLGAVVTGGG